LREPAQVRCPEELAAHAHPRVGERLLKSVLMLEDLSVRSGLGGATTAHGPAEIDATIASYRAAFERMRAGQIL
jgi:hypothetical protein